MPDLELCDRVSGIDISSAVKKELNLVRRNNMVGAHLRKELVRIYQQHNIRD